jgi:predicted TIM-barrel fold metal-dependent hydrolase
MTAAAACGIAGMSRAASGASGAIVDTHVYLGDWVHKRLPTGDLAEFITALRRNNVSQAWTGSFDGLFHKDIAGVNERLTDSCARNGGGILVPFGTVNPTLPDWEEDVRRCHETFHMPGIRLHPNYHGYALDEPRFGRLLHLAAGFRLIVQVVAWMDDERHMQLSPPATHVDLKHLAEKVAPLGELRLVVSNGDSTSQDEAFRALSSLKQVYYDFARATSAAEIRQLGDTIGIHRVVFGTGAPLHSFEPVRARLGELQLSASDLRAIRRTNARRLVWQARKTSRSESQKSDRALVSIPLLPPPARREKSLCTW